MMIRVFYRVSDVGHGAPRPHGMTKVRCLENLLSVFAGEEVCVIADRCATEMTGYLQGLRRRERVAALTETDCGNSGSFREAVRQALRGDGEHGIVYFVEDDYAHRAGAPTLLREGIRHAEYLTLYDHPDKYRAEYGHGEVSKVIRTPSAHWRYTISTCMTFATTVGTLGLDEDVWERFSRGPGPSDHKAFCELRGRYQRLAVCMPGAACHMDLTYSNQAGEFLIEPWAIEALQIQVPEVGACGRTR
jgi:hypothetical protein